MNRGIKLGRLQERQGSGLSGIGLKYDRNIIPNPFIFNRVYILMIPLLILTCIANTVCGAGEINEEYFSNDVPKAIPDAGTTTSTLAITDVGTIVDLNVKLDIDHTSDGNMDIYLIAPDGTRVELFTDVGLLSDNFKDTIVDNEAALSITEGSAPFTGSYRPEGNLADLYNKDINGTWTLEVTDDWSGDTGTLNS